jgi:hypothetical protein
MSDFTLKKWYLDAADEQGNVYIGYWASLQWRNLSLHFYQHLYHSDEQGIQIESGLTNHAEPKMLGTDQLVWQTPALNARWHSSAKALDETLLCTRQGRIHWHCFQPKAEAKIELSYGSFNGLGYTECIDVTIPPWQFPFSTLYWGRAHSEHDYLVWIQMEGENPQTLVWHNGLRSSELDIRPQEICGEDFQLTLTDSTNLRQGQIGSTIFQPFKNFLQLFPERVLGIYEHKLYNQGRLLTKNRQEKAVTIYEQVHW